MKEIILTPSTKGGFKFQTGNSVWKCSDKIDALASIFACLDCSYSEVKQAYALKIQQTQTTLPDIYTVREYMKLKNLTRQGVYYLISTGKLSKEKIEGYTFVKEL